MRISVVRHLFLCAVALPLAAPFIAPLPAFAQERPRDDFHGAGDAEIVVTAAGVKELDILAGTSVLAGDALQRNLNGQIGEVLARLPGVSATGFSPGASRPVLRGFQGARITVLDDGIGALDASNTSADHAVALDPLTMERVEVLRGPAVLLYGGQAIGGAVNVLSKRIPRAVPDEAVHVDALAGIDTAYDLREVGASFDVPAAENVAIHFDGSWRRTRDMEIAGYALAPALRAGLLAEAAAEPDEAEELAEAAGRRGVLPNSATESWSLGGGIALFSGESNLGFSAGYYDTRYGVPERPGAGHHHHPGEEGEEPSPGVHDHAEEAPVSIAMTSFRADLRGKLALGGAFSELRLRAGYADYRHVEYEGDEVGTRFAVEGVEARAELVQAERGGWRGSLGAQFLHRDFNAIGAEAFVAPHRTEQYALFALQEVSLGPVELEAAGRYERTRVNSGALAMSRGFDAFSGALGLAHETAGGLRFGINGSRAVRAPSGEELFSNGPHIATRQFEMGDPALTTEKAWGLEAYLRGAVGPVTAGLSIYRSWFSDYISLDATGAEEDGLPIFRHVQGDARHFGLEGEASWPFLKRDGLTLVGEVSGSYVRAEMADGAPLPRIPPLSLLGALEARTDPVDARLEVQWFDAQRRIAAFETETGAYTLVNASLAWRPMPDRRNVTIMAQADNIFDVTGRRHASFTKDFVPLAGRNFKLSARFSF